VKAEISKSRETLSRGQFPKKATYFLGRLLTCMGLLIIALALVFLVVKANRVYRAYKGMAPHLANLKAIASVGLAKPNELDLAQLEDSLRHTATGLETLHEELRPFLPLTRYLGWVPIYGGDIQAAPYLLAAGRDLSRAGVILLERFSPLLEYPSDVEQASVLSQAVTTLAQARADLDQAEQLLRQAQASLDAVEGERLSPLLADQVAPLKGYLSLATSGLKATSHLPNLLGAESPQTYLILTQNMDEIRPTGGYINAAGHVVLDQGQIVEFVMGDSYAVDQLSEAYPYPPTPIRQYMAADYWVLRDANWSPDFPTSARSAIELYELGQGISANGVVVLDQQALAYLVRAFEPIDVDGEQVTSKNVIELMRRQWEQSPDQKYGEWWGQRKSFMVALAQTARDRFEHDIGSISLPVLVDALQQALAEKHILVYLEDPVAAEFLAQQNWSGSLYTGPGDYLMVVDANLGFNKASALVERSTIYHITLAEDGSAQARAKLSYQHPAQRRVEPCLQKPRYDPVYEQNMERCYWNYVRLVVPSDAQLLSGPGIIVDGQYLLRSQSSTGEIDVEPLGSERTGWGQLFLLAPGESLSLDYVYTLQPSTARRVDDHWVYSLYLQKQPGTLQPPVEIFITLPEGAQFLESQPQPLNQQGSVGTYSVSLSTDRKIEISYHFP
jgi:hypothetical protein